MTVQMQTLISATPEELLEMFRPMLRFELGQLLAESAAPAPEAEELLTVREAARLLDVCQATIHDYKRRGMLPYHEVV